MKCMKTTYLIREAAGDPDSPLRQCSAAEWSTIVRGNRGSSPETRRYFICDAIYDGENSDCIVYETDLVHYRAWDREQKRMAAHSAAANGASVCSLEALSASMPEPLPLPDPSPLPETRTEEKLWLESLANALAHQKPWNLDFLCAYLNEEQTGCCRPIARRYGVSIRTVQRGRNAFEASVCRFFRN